MRWIAWTTQAWLVAMAALTIASLWALDAPHASLTEELAALAALVAWSCAPYVALSVAAWRTRSPFGRRVLALTTVGASLPMLVPLWNALMETNHSWVLVAFVLFPAMQLAAVAAAVGVLVLRWWLARRRGAATSRADVLA